MRRGYLYAKAKELGCNKIALGHHKSDVIETTLMAMLYGGQIQGMLPRLKSKNFEGLELIRPMYCIAEEDLNPPLGRYEKYPVKDAALLMTSADNFFWTFEQAASYYQFAIVNYIGFRDRGMLLAGGCGDTNGKPQIDKTNHLAEAYEFGKRIYE